MRKSKLLITTILFTIATTLLGTPVYADGLIPMDIDATDVYEGFSELMEIDSKKDDAAIEPYYYSSEDGEYINYSNSTEDEDYINYASERKYDSRDYDIITGVKNQNPYGSCWSFAVMSQAETSALLKNEVQGIKNENGEVVSPDFSELHLVYFSYNDTTNSHGKIDSNIYYNLGRSIYDAGGNDYYAIAKLMNWKGIAKEKAYPYSNAGKLNFKIDKSESDVHDYMVNGFYLIPTKGNDLEDVKDVIKNCIVKFGSVGWSYNSDLKNYYSTTISGNKVNSYSSISTNGVPENTNHAITVVGWDDDYPVEYFMENHRPNNPGAWLIKNSYGTYPGDEIQDGYFYMSYEEPTIGIGNPASVITVEPHRSDYDNNYYNSNGLISSSRVYTATENAHKVANVYTANGSDNAEKIKAVSFVTTTASNDYSIQIYKNLEMDDVGNVKDPEQGIALLSEPVTGHTSYAGLTTVEINDDIEIRHGDVFSVVLSMSAGTKIIYDKPYARTSGSQLFTVTQPAVPGRSFSVNSQGVFKDENSYESSSDGKYYRLNVITDDYHNPNIVHKPESWEFVGGKKYYYDKDLKTLSGFVEIDGQKYHFGEDGAVSAGFVDDANSHTYYMKNVIPDLTKEDYLILNKTVYVDDLFNSSLDTYNPELYEKIMEHGVMQTGLCDIKGVNNPGRYYFSSKGYMQKGWKTLKYKYLKTDANGKTKKVSRSGKYYFDNVTGKMSEGVTKIGSKYYYFATADDKYLDKSDFYSIGKVTKGSVEAQGKRYVTNSSGVLKSGWQKFHDGRGTKSTKDDTYTWRYFANETGGFSEIGGYEPFVAKGEGSLSKAQYPHWVSVSSNSTEEPQIYCFNSKSGFNKGWKVVTKDLNGDTNKSKYYFGSKTGELYRGERKIGKRTYFFGELSGKYVPSASKYRVLKYEDGKVFCYTAKGKRTTGFRTIGYRYEYLDNATGRIEGDTKIYKFYFIKDKNDSHYGEMCVGNYTIKDKTYTFSDDDKLISESADGMRGALIE